MESPGGISCTHHAADQAEGAAGPPSSRRGQKETMIRLLVPIALGGSVGALLRFGVSRFITQTANTAFPMGTAAVNIAGSFVLGFLYVLFDEFNASPDMKGFFTVGLLGAFTTFSTFSLETMALIQDGELRYALYNVLANNCLSLAAAWGGIYLCRIAIRVLKAG